MKPSIKLFMVITLVFAMSTTLNGQKWRKSSTNFNDSNESPSFFELQKEFYDYWESFNVEKGRYINEKGELVKAAGWKQFKRWEWYMNSHINQLSGRIEMPLEFIRRSSVNQSESNNDIYSNWTSLGPNSSDGGYAGVGRINTVAFHPTDLNTFWVGTPGGGLWKTTDNGQSWASFTDELEAIGVSNVIIPSNYETTKTIYISTGDRNGFDTKSSGIYKSTDDGKTWSKAGISFTTSSFSMVYHMLLDPQDDNHLIAATSVGLKETKNGATSWTDLGATAETLKYLEFQPGSVTTMYAVGSSKFYKSTDGGATWTEKLSMPGGHARITVTAADPNRIYIVSADSELKKIYRSNDAGETFSEMLDGATKNLLGYKADGSDLTEGQGWYDLTIEASPKDADVVFVGGVNTWKTTDGGTNWVLANHWVGNGGVQTVHADKHEIVFRSNGDMFEANDGGLYISSDGTTFVNNSNGIVNSQIYKLDVSPTQVITGLQDNGSKLFNGTTWKDVNGGDGMQCIIDPTNNQIQYSSSQNGSISKTTDAWESTFFAVSENIGDGTLKGAWVTPYALDPNDNKTLFVAYDEIWKSTDQGETFTKISSFGVGQYMQEMAIAQSNSNYIYVYDQVGFYVTKDGGTTWDTSIQLPDTDLVTDIEVDVKDPEKIWISFGNYDKNRVFQSVDAGKNWTDISQGLPEVPTLDLIQRDDHTGLQLYAGTDIGVYVKNDDADWELFSKGLPNIIVNDFDIRYDANNSNDGKLVAVTYGRGTWISPLYPDLKVPRDINLSATSINENNQADAVVAELSTLGNANQTYTYSLVGDGTDKAAFKISANKLLAAQAFNFETKSSYSIRIKTCDTNNQCYEKDFTITVLDINEAPATLELSASNIAENQEVGVVIGDLSTTDEDANETHSYSFETGGADNASFALDANKLKSAVSFDFEVKSSFNIKLSVCDSKNACLVKDFVITIDNVNEAPTDITLDNLVIEENNEDGATVGNLSVTDVDIDDTHTYSLVGSGNDNSFFSIDSNILKAQPLDFENKENLTVLIQVEDAGALSIQKEFTITVTNVIESKISGPPTISFDDTPLDWMSEETVDITNSGETVLSLSIAASNNAFEVLTTSLDLEIGETKQVNLRFKPTQTQVYEAALSFKQDNFTAEIPLRGTGAIITDINNGQNQLKDVVVYPNPASDLITIDLSTFSSERPDVKLISPEGSELVHIQKPVTDKVEVNTSTYPSGVYIVLLQLKDQALTKKVIIKKP